MGCPFEKENAELLLAWGSRRLDAARAAMVEQHTAVCPDCRAMSESQRAVWSALDEWEPIAVREDFDSRLYARIQAEQRTPWWSKLSFGNWGLRPAMGVAALCTTVFCAFLLRAPDTAPVASTDQVVTVDTHEIEQVERTLEDIEMLKLLGPSPVEAAQTNSNKSL